MANQIVLKTRAQQLREQREFHRRMKEEFKNASVHPYKTSLTTKIGWYLPSGRAIQACIALPYLVAIIIFNAYMIIHALISCFS